MKVTFKEVEYTKEVLESLDTDQLLELRNEIAKELGVAELSSFKDHDTAVAQTTKALERFSGTSENEEKPKKAPKAKKEPKERGLAKSAEAKTVKRPTRDMFSTIKKIGTHDGTQGRQHRWDNYKDGMTIVDVIETEGCEPWDVQEWCKKGIMEKIEPTDEEYAERRAAWYKKEGRMDPDEEKRLKAEAKAKAAAERKEKAAAKAAAAEKAKAEKEAKAAAAAEKASQE